MITIAIVGSHHAVNREQVISLIDAFLMDFAGQEIEIVSGGAAEVDTFAEEYALEHGHAFVGFRPDAETGTFSQRCFKRDLKIAQRASYVLALPCEHSKGTWITVRLFNERGTGQRAVVHTIPCGLRDRYPRTEPRRRDAE